MFTIVISEKGGAERRETFDKSEISVGRVQGNGLMLPKGNVSKHHARLLYRDGRFIVTDLKSTNGTYVNGRKISQATIVREGDKIYVGDFVLRLETTLKATAHADEGGSEPAKSEPSPPVVSGRDGASPAPAQRGSRLPLPPPLPPLLGVPAASAGAAVPLGSSASPPERDGAGHYALERDSSESESVPELRDSGASGEGLPRMFEETEPRPRSTMAFPAHRPPAAPAVPPAAAQQRALRPGSVPAAAEGDPPQQAAHRLALVTLVDRVADVVDLSALEQSPVVINEVSQSIERAVRQQAKAMREAGEAPEGIDLDLLGPEALRELVGLGPLGPLLEDNDTSEIHVIRHDHVLSLSHGQTIRVQSTFTSEQALARVVARLAHQSGEPLRAGELVLHRSLPRGAHMTAIAPGAAGGWVVHVRKRHRVTSSLAELVRSGTISEAMAGLLEMAAAVRANVLVVGSGAGAVSSMLAAIATAAPPGERVVVLQQGAEEIVLPQAHVVSLALAGRGSSSEDSIFAAASLGMDRMIVMSLGGTVAIATIDVIADGSDAVLAGIGAPSLRHALARLVSQIALSRAGSTVDAAREAVGQSFDIAVEVQRMRGGKARAVRIAELAGSDGNTVVTRDLFVRSESAGGEPEYVATGVSPRVVRDFENRMAKPNVPPVPRRSGK